RRIALGALELAARLARLHLRIEALHFQPDALLHHLVLPREHFLGGAHFEPRLRERGAKAEHVGAFDGEERRAALHALPGLDLDRHNASREGRGDCRKRFRTESGAAEIAAALRVFARVRRLDDEELARRLRKLHGAAAAFGGAAGGAARLRVILATGCRQAKRQRNQPRPSPRQQAIPPKINEVACRLHTKLTNSLTASLQVAL